MGTHVSDRLLRRGHCLTAAGTAVVGSGAQVSGEGTSWQVRHLRGGLGVLGAMFWDSERRLGMGATCI